jgi:hypothetical protein
MSSGHAPYQVLIETAEEKRARRGRYEPKGRSFGASCVALQMAHGYWEGSSRNPLRPTFALFVVSKQGARPFVMNLRSGRKLHAHGLGSDRNGWPMEFLKSVGYEVREQDLAPADDESEPTVAIEVFLRPLFEYRPGMLDPMAVTFTMSLPMGRLAQESERFSSRGLDRLLVHHPLKETDDYKARNHGAPFDRATVIAEGVRFAAALNERGLLPMPPDPLFCTHLLLSALGKGYARRNMRAGEWFAVNDNDAPFVETGMAFAHRAPGLVFRLSQSEVARWLSEEVLWWERHRLNA